ncbi:hypothetical protein [Psychromonas sp. SP041]|uniref:hypothetical protein n=1 Tax=Psychromonas sp. SP041 TaxID=1365007 RepID=UPI000409AB8A|nr:hypothetical protein [Psychromonas sp. SP041]
MSKIIKRPDYISYDQRFIKRGEWSQEDINSLESERALAQWEVKNAFMWKIGPWAFHLKVLAIPLFILMIVFFSTGFSPMTLTAVILVFVMFGPIYYLSRSQYHYVAYKLTDSGFLLDNLKVYPRFRYGRQDPRKFMAFMRIVAVILVIIALVINPLYLMGAGSVMLLSFMKPWVDDGEKVLYVPFYWHDHRAGDRSCIYKVNICKKRRIVELKAKDPTFSCRLFCTKQNFEQIIQIVIDRLPSDVEYVQDEPIYQ